jgi:hypothetical protein
MRAGYIRVWLSMEEAIDHVTRVAKCSPKEARDALVQALIDGELRSRFGDNGLQEVKAFLWHYARQWAPCSGLGAKAPNRSQISGDAAYLRPYFDPPPDPALLPARMRSVEVRREDVARLWPAPPIAASLPETAQITGSLLTTEPAEMKPSEVLIPEEVAKIPAGKPAALKTPPTPNPKGVPKRSRGKAVHQKPAQFRARKVLDRIFSGNYPTREEMPNKQLLAKFRMEWDKVEGKDNDMIRFAPSSNTVLRAAGRL